MRKHGPAFKDAVRTFNKIKTTITKLKERSVRKLSEKIRIG